MSWRGFAYEGKVNMKKGGRRPCESAIAEHQSAQKTEKERKEECNTMPITPDFTWQESEDWVKVDVSLGNFSPSSVDITTTECFVKVNCHPFLFQADLAEEIDMKESSGVVNKDGVHFFLAKKEEGLWGKLTAVGNRKEIMARHERSLEAAREYSRKMKEEAPLRKSNIGRIAVDKQMTLDEIKRKAIDNRKEAELSYENSAISKWQEQLSKNQSLPLQGAQLNATKLDDINGEVPVGSDQLSVAQTRKINELSHTTTVKPKTPTLRKENVQFVDENSSKICINKNQQEKLPIINVDKDCELDYVEDTFINTMRNDNSKAPSCQTKRTENDTKSIAAPRKIQVVGPFEKRLPAPRKSSCVQVTFSPKPTLPNHLPARESRETKVELKNHHHENADSIDVSEREPLFLQDKGDRCFRAGDYRSATNAYSDAISRDAAMLYCYANRAACRLQLKQAQGCIDDCNTAICLLKTDEVLDLQCDIMDGTSVAYVKKYRDNPSEGLGLLVCLTRQRTSGNDIRTLKNSVLSRVLIRKGTANCLLGNLQQAVADFAEALGLFPKNAALESSLKEMQAKLVSPEDSRDEIAIEENIIG